MSYRHSLETSFVINAQITTATGDTTLVAAPGAGYANVLQVLTVCITTAAAQAFDVEDSSATVEFFKAPASLAVGTYGVDYGPRGAVMTENETLVFNTASAGVGATISGFGYIRKL